MTQTQPLGGGDVKKERLVGDGRTQRTRGPSRVASLRPSKRPPACTPALEVASAGTMVRAGGCIVVCGRFRRCLWLGISQGKDSLATSTPSQGGFPSSIRRSSAPPTTPPALPSRHAWEGASSTLRSTVSAGSSRSTRCRCITIREIQTFGFWRPDRGVFTP